nr:MAG TPA: Neuropeptide K, 3 10 helix, lipid [Caudoviricetes sp.]
MIYIVLNRVLRHKTDSFITIRLKRPTRFGISV